MSIAQLIDKEFEGKRDLSGIGGVETGRDAAEFLLLGANSVQVRRSVSMLCRFDCRLCCGPYSPECLVQARLDEQVQCSTDLRPC